MKRLGAVLIAFAVVVGGAAAWAWNEVRAPLSVPTDSYVLQVAKGTSLSAVANRLAADGVLAHPLVFSWYGRLSGQAHRIQAGEYALGPETTPANLLSMLVEGRVLLHALTVIEGWTVSDLVAAVAAHPAIARTLRARDPAQLPDALGMDTDSPEGWFFPDTYRFPRGTTDVRLLLQAYRMMQAKLEAAWRRRQPGTILNSPYEALILASIVERESALESERPRIAGVFLRRLERNMRLQTDPTVIYGLGDAFDGNLTRRHLRQDTPYNTYVRRGLPPTPISLPGADALDAVVNPAPGDELYFVATGKGDGSHAFSATLEEHNAAVERYLANLRETRP